MFIDVHGHAFKNHPPIGGRTVFSNAEEVLRRYDEAGIEKGALLPIVSPEFYLPQSNEDILEMVEKYPDRFFPFCNIDPRSITNSVDAPLGDILRYYKDKGCKGLGEVMPNLAVNDPKVQNLFKHAEDVGLPLTFDMMGSMGRIFGLYDEVGLPYLEQSLQRFPALVILGHSTAFWAEIGKLRTPADRSAVLHPNWDATGGFPNYPIDEEGAVPWLFRRYPNLYGDLSADCGYNALARDRAYGIKFLNEFQDRLLFGTDICPPDMPFTPADYLIELRDSGEISEQVFNKIARENAIKLFDL
jgi:uncharacterized protein